MVYHLYKFIFGVKINFLKIMIYENWLKKIAVPHSLTRVGFYFLKYLEVDNCILKVETLAYPNQLMDFEHMMEVISQFRLEEVLIMIQSALVQHVLIEIDQNDCLELSKLDKMSNASKKLNVSIKLPSLEIIYEWIATSNT